MDFNEWMLNKYLEYRGNAVGRERSATDFARYLGFTQPTMSSYLKQKGGSKPKNISQIKKLYRKYGPEIYDVLGLPRPDPITDLEARLKDIPPGEQHKIIKQIRDWAEDYGAKIETREK